MLTNEQITEIREHLENAKNPVFFYDNDPDGFCSFILLQRYLGRGRGIIIKSFPTLDKTYFKRVEELNADYIFVLDKPTIDPGFIELAQKANIPLVHIDHHPVPKTPIKYYYNTYYVDKKYDPVSYLCYKISGRREDMWIAAIGCITDSFLPDFMEGFKKSFPELIDCDYKTAADILYNSFFGKICMTVSFAMKDNTSNVVSMSRFFMKAMSAHDIFEESKKTKIMLKRFEEINEKYQRILKKAEESVSGEVLFFNYSGDLSISQYVANELFYKHPKKVIIVVYTRGNISNLSLRWERDIRVPVVNAVACIEGASGGGHEHASGARMTSDKVEAFKEKLLEEIEKVKKT
jgi:single-stranded DNA-specific DHH superfamily exonuclease